MPIDYEKYLKIKRDERFCSAPWSALLTGDGLSCGTFLGYEGDEPDMARFKRLIRLDNGTIEERWLCASCQDRYRDQIVSDTGG